MSKIDWSKAGKRIRWQKGTVGHNPDWNWMERRWKDEADYYAEELGTDAVMEVADCPRCGRLVGMRCLDERGDYMEVSHRERRRHAGELLLDVEGPRFSKGKDSDNEQVI